MNKFLPVVFRVLVNVDFLKDFAWMPHFVQDHIWYISSEGDTPNSTAIQKLLQNSSLRQISNSKTILDVRTVETKIYECVRFEDGSVLLTVTVRYPDGSLRSMSRFRSHSEFNAEQEKWMFRQTSFACKYCLASQRECVCSSQLKLRSSSAGVTQFNNNSSKHLHWYAMRRFMHLIYDSNMGRNDVQLYDIIDGMARLQLRSSTTMRYYSPDTGSPTLLGARSHYLAKTMILVMSPINEISIQSAVAEELHAQEEESCNAANGVEHETPIDDTHEKEAAEKVEDDEVLDVGLEIIENSTTASNENSIVSLPLEFEYVEGNAEEAARPSNGFFRPERPVDGYSEQVAHDSDGKMPVVENNTGLAADARNSPNLFCNRCGRKFKRRYDLRRHITTVHDKVRNFRCDTCDLSFLQRAHLNEHVSSVHEKLRDIKCPKCDFSFSSKSRLQRHDRAVHQRLRPFACDQCDCRYFQRTDLKKHQVSKHTGKAA